MFARHRGWGLGLGSVMTGAYFKCMTNSTEVQWQYLRAFSVVLFFFFLIICAESGPEYNFGRESTIFVAIHCASQ